MKIMRTSSLRNLAIFVLVAVWAALTPAFAGAARTGIVAELTFLQQLAACGEIVGGINNSLKEDRGGNPDVRTLAMELLQTVSGRLQAMACPAPHLEPMHQYMKDLVNHTRQALEHLHQSDLGQFQEETRLAAEAFSNYIAAWQAVQANYK